MAAPSAVTRVSPVGIKLWDGFSSKIAFSQDTNISLWEISVTPIGFDGGDPIDQTTMYNNRFYTQRLGSLIKTTDGSFTAAYDPDVVNQIIAILNVEGTLTIHYPDGSNEPFYGGLRMFDQQELVINGLPTANVTITPTNVDPSNNWVEAGPLVNSATGT